MLQKLYHETFTVMDNMLQSCVADQLQEFILTVYLCIKGNMYPDSLSRILYKIATLKTLSLFIVRCGSCVTID